MRHSHGLPLVTLLVLVLGGPAAAQEPAVALDSIRGSLDSLSAQTVVDAELDFAQAALELGIRDSFLAFLAEDAVVFAPRATNGREHYASVEPGAVLEWAPVLAEASAADDLGYTTGPYVLRPAPGAAATGHGWYFSVWRRSPEGVWQVVLDLGTPTTVPPRQQGGLEIPVRDAAPPADGTDRDAQLLVLDDLIGAAARRRSARRALTPILSTDARLNDAGQVVRGGVLVSRTIPDTAIAYERLGHGISQSSDLAYTYGEYTMGSRPSAELPTGNWLRVWRVGLDGNWSIIQLVMAPIQH